MWSSNRGNVVVRQVWETNFEDEIHLLDKFIGQYPNIALDAKFARRYAGIVAYDSLKDNVGKYKLIQLGVTISDNNGNLPRLGGNGRAYASWQFNFRGFHPDEDIHEPEWIACLRRRGVNFDRQQLGGVDPKRLGQDLLIHRNWLANDNRVWITYSGAVDFGYMLKFILGEDLPKTKSEFLQLVSETFSKFYDMQYVCSLGGYGNYIMNSFGKTDKSALGDRAGFNSLDVSLNFHRPVFYGTNPSMFRGDLQSYASCLYLFER